MAQSDGCCYLSVLPVRVLPTWMCYLSPSPVRVTCLCYPVLLSVLPGCYLSIYLSVLLSVLPGCYLSICVTVSVTWMLSIYLCYCQCYLDVIYLSVLLSVLPVRVTCLCVTFLCYLNILPEGINRSTGQHHLFGNPPYKFSSHNSNNISYYFRLPGDSH